MSERPPKVGTLTTINGTQYLVTRTQRSMNSSPEITLSRWEDYRFNPRKITRGTQAPPAEA